MGEDFEKLSSWLSKGKQLGVRFSFEKNQKLYWSSVGIQFWDGVYKVYVDEILEANMNSEEYSREEVLKFLSLDEALEYIREETEACVSDLAPCKGLKIFNPSFDS